MGARLISQHLDASLLITTEERAEAHCTVNSTPSENGLEACRTLINCFDPASVQGKVSLVSPN